MTSQPTLETDRLTLSPFVPADAAAVKLKAGDKRVAEMTENIPHPYEDGMAEKWISRHVEKWNNRSSATWAVRLKNLPELMGCVGLVLNNKHSRASLGYWVSPAHWSKGYCTEAARTIVRYGFSDLNLQRIEATHLTINPASGAVMRKLGMKHEGTMKNYVVKEGVFEDMEIYALVASGPSI